MKPFKLCYFSATATDIPSLSKGVQRFKANGGEIDVYARTQGQLLTQAGREAFIRAALSSDAVIITFHGGTASFPAFSIFAETFSENQSTDQRPYLHLQPIGVWMKTP
jgi:cobaltochelatase CobN